MCAPFGNQIDTDINLYCSFHWRQLNREGECMFICPCDRIPLFTNYPAGPPIMSYWTCCSSVPPPGSAFSCYTAFVDPSYPQRSLSSLSSLSLKCRKVHKGSVWPSTWVFKRLGSLHHSGNCEERCLTCFTDGCDVAFMILGGCHTFRWGFFSNKWIMNAKFLGNQ